MAAGNGTTVGGLRAMTLEHALVRVAESFYRTCSRDAQIALLGLKDGSVLARQLLDGSHSVVAGRLAGALRACVRAVLGHFVFVFTHPYPDGNGRMGRFLMNAMMASGGYPWTVIELARRSEYMAALDEASSRGNIVPFAEFVAASMRREAEFTMK